MTDLEHVDFMAKIGLLTEEGAERARKKLAELAAEAEAGKAPAEGGPGLGEVGAGSVPQAG